MHGDETMACQWN